MPRLYPLQFKSLFRRYLWGGRRLAELLHKPLGPGDDYAESWEVVDHGSDQSVVAEGPLQGQTLGQLANERGEDLFGRHFPQPQFPLLFKFLDAHRHLSVQVHPDDEAASRLDPPDLGKTEAWVVVHAEPGSRIYAGLKRGFDRAALEREVHRGTTELCLHAFEPQAGDCLFVPAGALHALGSGLVVAEIQQASDTTFRLFDWNRVGPDGKPRTLHIPQALDSIDFQLGPLAPQTPEIVPPTAADAGTLERLVACDKFVLDRWSSRQPASRAGDACFHIYSVLDGRVELRGTRGPISLNQGDCVLIPACEPAIEVTPHDHVVLLDMYLP